MAYGAFILQAITVLILGWLIKSYFPSYLAEKGKNLATKEDVAQITAEVEKTRLVYAADLEKLKHELQQGLEVTKHELASEGGMLAFVDAIQKMREESMSHAEWVSKGAIGQMLFSRALRD